MTKSGNDALGKRMAAGLEGEKLAMGSLSKNASEAPCSRQNERINITKGLDKA